MEYLNLHFTEHADVRAQQRGIKKSVMNFILKEADVDLPAGRGCRSLLVSQKKLKILISENKVQPKFADRVNGVVLIEHENELITLFHKTKRKRYP
jgi:hypothetical protein